MTDEQKSRILSILSNHLDMEADDVRDLVLEALDPENAPAVALDLDLAEFNADLAAVEALAAAWGDEVLPREVADHRKAITDLL
jgi:hypothetical protein